jgi:hypothetical protein
MRFSVLACSAFSVLVCASAAIAAPYTNYPRAVVLSGVAVNLTWQDSGGYPSDYWQIYRDGILYATSTTTSYTDTALSPGENHTYYIASHSTQTYSVPSRSLTVTTKTPDNSFVLDGIVDFSAYTWLYPSGCDCTNLPSLPLYAALRGHTLYVATASPGAPNQSPTDRFILISDVLDPSLTTPAPWAKPGVIAVPAGKPFIGAESTNNFVGWFNAPASAQVVRSNNYVEGTIDLIETFGHIPTRLYMAVVAYNTGDGGQLIWQAPNPDGSVDNVVAADEFLVLNTAGLQDDDADGILDLTDPAKGLTLNIGENSDGSVTLSFPTVAWRTYVLDRTFALGDQWSTVRAYFPQNGEFSASYTDPYPTYYPDVKAFYKLSVEEPN